MYVRPTVGTIIWVSKHGAIDFLDNAEKYIEEGHYDEKGSDPPMNPVLGDTFGDPLKDTAGPSLNTMISVMSLVASIFAPLFALFSLLG